jgi:NAD+ synthase
MAMDATVVNGRLLGPDVLRIDAADAVDVIGRQMRRMMRELRRRGCVVAVSGGVDSAVCAALCAHAFGGDKVYALLLPERDSSPDSLHNGRLVAEQFGLAYEVQEITSTLDAIGCYRLRDEAIRAVFPDYGAGWMSKIVFSGREAGRLSHFRLVVQSPQGEVRSQRLPLHAYLQLVAATSYKQRTRKTIEYYHADRLNYAVIGTPNRLEYDQGFFVKNGDGAADIKPIAHLYKTQVYQLARHLGLPEAICNAVPTTDTYSMVQGQDEFYFGLPYAQMDLALWAFNHGVPAERLGEAVGASSEQSALIYRDIEAKRRAARYHHATPMLVEAI